MCRTLICNTQMSETPFQALRQNTCYHQTPGHIATRPRPRMGCVHVAVCWFVSMNHYCKSDHRNVVSVLSGVKTQCILECICTPGLRDILLVLSTAWRVQSCVPGPGVWSSLSFVVVWGACMLRVCDAIIWPYPWMGFGYRVTAYAYGYEVNP